MIVATGATARQLGLESERALHGRGVTYCATCDAAFYRDREVVVVGGGDSAMEEALYLTKFASKVTLVHRRGEFRASQIMVDRAKSHEKIEIVTPFVVEEVLGVDSGKLTGVLLRNVETDETVEHPTDGLFVAIGHDPTTTLFVDGSTTTRTATSSPRARRRRRTSPASSPRATSGSRLPAGDHGRRLELRSGARRGAVPRRGGGASEAALTAPREHSASA